MHCTNAIDSEPSCSSCRKRFSNIDITKIADVEWSTFAIVSFLKKYDDTKFVNVKSGRKFGGSAWGSLRDKADKWGFEFTVKTGAGLVS